VDADQCQQAQARAPNHQRFALEEVGVVVDEFRRAEDLQVADQMADDEQEQQRAAPGHQILFAERRFKDSCQITHGNG
jgi:hypothetical protein